VESEARRRRAWILACAAVWLGLAPAGVTSREAWAAITAPALALYSVDALAGASGTLVRLRGAVPDADLVQQAIEIHVLVRELRTGSRFVAFSLPFGAFEGNDPNLVGGVDADAVFSLLEVMRPSAEARILELSSSRVEIQLPRSFPPGPAEAVLFLVYEGEPILSNPVVFVVGTYTP
jgi:hypothetical protein